MLHGPFVNCCLVSTLAAVFISSSLAQEQCGSTSREEIHDLVGRILKRFDQAKCHPKGCTILVANFTTPSGSTSRLGIQLADSVSAELLSQENGIQIVDRNRLRDYLVHEHIPSRALKDREAARWLATEFRANVVLIGTIEQLGDRFNLLTELLNICNDKVGPLEAMWIPISEPLEAFVPFEPYDGESPTAKTTSDQGSGAFRSGANGAGVPECIYCPPPQYSRAAQKTKFKGAVALEVTVTEDGRTSGINVLKGVPFGLNGEAIKAVRKWKFKPATLGGMPVSVAVPIEITFSLN